MRYIPIYTNSSPTPCHGIKTREELIKTIQNTFNKSGEVALLRKTKTKTDDGIRLVTALKDESPRAVTVQISRIPEYKDLGDQIHKPIANFLDSLIKLSPELEQYKERIFLFDKSHNTKELPERQKTILPKEVPSSTKQFYIPNKSGLDIISDQELLEVKTYLARVANPNATIIQKMFVGK